MPAGADDLAEDSAAAHYAAWRERAYQLLARREHSAAELRRKLREKMAKTRAKTAALAAHSAAKPASTTAVPDDLTDPDALLTRLLAELAEAGAQSDARFAEMLCRRRFADGRGPRKLKAELASHAIAPELVAALLAAYADRWPAQAEAVRRRKFGDAPATYHEWAKQARFLAQRGFADSQIPPFAGSK